MYHVYWDFWWVIIPIGYFVYRAWARWLSYQRSRHALEVMKEYAAQGKEPPPELVQQAQDDAYGRYGDGYRYSRHDYRRDWRGPPPPPPPAGVNPDPLRPADPIVDRYWRGRRHSDWHGAVVTGAVAAAFWIASEYDFIPDADGPFRFVAVILTCVSVALLALALFSSFFRDR